MAKKSKKSASAKTSKAARSAKRPAAKAPKKKAKAPAARTPAGKAAGSSTLPPGVHQFTTGGGPGPREIGTDLVALFNAGKADEVEKKWWSPDIVSIEGMGMAWSGRKSVEAKNAEWLKANEILGGSAEGPFVGASGFAVRFRIHVKDRASGSSQMMDEVGVYTVHNGKITREEFMYGS
ncbi:MAG: nuclear transport factor 2 family protein [Phycisphaerae bacterium]|nr:nuclear transport factor 2 family protein [Phycisphaerae bacterium]